MIQKIRLSNGSDFFVGEKDLLFIIGHLSLKL